MIGSCFELDFELSSHSGLSCGARKMTTCDYLYQCWVFRSLDFLNWSVCVWTAVCCCSSFFTLKDRPSCLVRLPWSQNTHAKKAYLGYKAKMKEKTPTNTLATRGSVYLPPQTETNTTGSAGRSSLARGAMYILRSR